MPWMMAVTLLLVHPATADKALVLLVVWITLHMDTVVVMILVVAIVLGRAMNPPLMSVEYRTLVAQRGLFRNKLVI
jgi:hypothetical protein